MANKQNFIAAGPNKPSVPTSPFDWSFRNRMTARFGRVYPCFVAEVPAKSRVTIRPTIGFDMLPLKFPVQTNMRCHVKFYKVPMRILWDKFEDFVSQIGVDGLPLTSSASPLKMPFISRTDWVKQGSLADYMGLPTNLLSQVACFTPTLATLCAPISATSLTVWDFLRLSDVNNADPSNCSIVIPLPNSNSYLVSNNLASNNINCLFKFTIVTNSDAALTADLTIRAHTLPNGYDSYFDAVRGTDSFKLDMSSTAIEDIAPSNNLQSTAALTYNQVTESVVINGVSYKRVDYYVRPSAAFLSAINTMRLNGNEVAVSVQSSDMSNWISAFNSFGNFTGSSEGSISTVDLTDPAKPLFFMSSIRNGLYGEARFFNNKVLSTNPTVFDAVDGNVPELPINALPFRAYQFVHNYFNRNVRIDPFQIDSVNQYNTYITNCGSGADTTTPLEFVNSLYETDLFTSCLKEPQFGNAPLVGVTLNDTSDTGVLHFDDGTTDYDVSVNFDGDGNVLPLSVYPTGTANDPAIHRLQDVINFGISISDLRNVGTFQRALERMQRTDHKFDNVIYEFFGTNPPLGDRYPTLLGGFVEDIHIGKISNTSAAGNAKLGEFAGTGYFKGRGRKVKVFCTEPSYIIGICYFTITPSYPQMLPKHFVKSDVFDYLLNPEFATMSAQPVYKYQIAPLQLSSEHLHDVFGYNRPYSEYVSRQDEVHGDFRGNMADFVLTRWFGDAPTLNKSFIEIEANDLTNIFSITANEDKIFGEIYFDCKASLPLPRNYTARSI